MTAEAPYILVVEDDRATAMVVERMLQHAGWSTHAAGTAAAAREVASAREPAIVLLDLGLPDMPGLALLPWLRDRCVTAWIVVFTADHRIATVVEAMQAGANDYLAKPIDAAKLGTLLGRFQAARTPPAPAAAPSPEAGSKAASYGIAGLVGDSPAIRRVFGEVEKVAPRDVSVLLHGESGTGKELLARAIHESSPRTAQPFVAVNCAAIAESLHEAELFGFEKGAFTGASHRQAGRFEQAHRGTLFLDEVAELSLGLQAKLLRALQEQAFYRVGGSEELRVNVRVVAATHRDLRREVAEGRFREDLYFRLAVFEIALPPLRERGDDLTLIIDYLMCRIGREIGQPIMLSASARRVLAGYSWPGNVREVRNCLYRAGIMADGRPILIEHLPPHLVEQSAAKATSSDHAAVAQTFAAPNAVEASIDDSSASGGALAAQERAAIVRAIEAHQQNLSEAARALGIGRTTLYRKMKRYGL